MFICFLVNSNIRKSKASYNVGMEEIEKYDSVSSTAFSSQASTPSTIAMSTSDVEDNIDDTLEIDQPISMDTNLINNSNANCTSSSNENIETDEFQASLKQDQDERNEYIEEEFQSNLCTNDLELQTDYVMNNDIVSKGLDKCNKENITSSNCILTETNDESNLFQLNHFGSGSNGDEAVEEITCSITEPLPKIEGAINDNLASDSVTK